MVCSFQNTSGDRFSLFLRIFQAFLHCYPGRIHSDKLSDLHDFMEQQFRCFEKNVPGSRMHIEYRDPHLL